MRPRVSWPPQAWIWGAGILVCLLGVSGFAVMARTTPPAHAGAASDELLSGEASSPMLQSPPRIANAGNSRAPCTECGTIASIREVASAADVGRQEQSEARRDHGVAIVQSTRTTAPSTADAPLYEVTVRFRDGRKSVFVEPGPPTWRVGSRIVVIDGATPKAN